MSEAPSILLNDTNTIPQIGFGVYQIEPEETERLVSKALEVGYRHIDTAEMYNNEAEVGQAIQHAGINRSEIFITTKLNNAAHDPDDTRQAFDESLEKLGVEYVDLFLIHWPLPTLYEGDFISTWKVLEDFKTQGRARSIGVSNFQTEHLERLLREATLPPAVNQIELHPYFQNVEVTRYNDENGIATEAWSPIAQGGVLNDNKITEIANSINKTPAQVVLRWHIQKGNIIFPKSATAVRIEENFAIFDFELSREQMRTIDHLDQGEDGRTGPHPDEFDYIPDKS